ncbi:hypothetical protein QTP70_032343 [Hemibagrus guttatus]|uniref:Integrase catalytic domain-containing protein n=1 Tax=Hemibagrus guttatus TaxID=175788 RepID=A0AAE0UWX1_9TELE|nr:hypothetical protein QTP70_032343 [Hemibagrus guttatus]
MTIPSFFHSGYCLPRSICWDGDDELNSMRNVIHGGQPKPYIIEISKRWEWLGLDIRGPFSITTKKHTHIMTLTDYYSKWVEAFPLTHNMVQDVAIFLAEVIRQLGYPLAVLSRIPKQLLIEINNELKKQININTNCLVIHHCQTEYLDQVTESLLNNLICELVKKYAYTWHIYLPAACLQLCCTEHPTTGQKPFTVMKCSGPPSFSTYRELPYSESEIHLSSFVIAPVEGSKGNTLLQVGSAALITPVLRKQNPAGAGPSLDATGAGTISV